LVGVPSINFTIISLDLIFSFITILCFCLLPSIKYIVRVILFVSGNLPCLLKCRPCRV
jgi:hypothetical protein